MPVPHDPAPGDDVVAALRAAGCVFAEDEAALLVAAASAPGTLAALVARRAAGEPLEHLLGWAEFAGLRVGVGPGVFVPRRRTELLVREAVRLLADRPGGARPSATAARSGPPPPSGPPPSGAPEPPGGPGRPAGTGGRLPLVVDLCCGSGAVGLAVAARAGAVRLVAADLDPAAVRCARRNLHGLGVVVAGDLLDALPAGLAGEVDVLVVNAPYVPTAEIGLMPSEARTHEPAVALDGGPDGLDVVRRVAAGAARWLAGGGHLVVETSERQAARVVAAVVAGGLPARVVRDDDLDATAVVGGPRSSRGARDPGRVSDPGDTVAAPATKEAPCPDPG